MDRSFTIGTQYLDSDSGSYLKNKSGLNSDPSQKHTLEKKKKRRKNKTIIPHGETIDRSPFYNYCKWTRSHGSL